MKKPTMTIHSDGIVFRDRNRRIIAKKCKDGVELSFYRYGIRDASQKPLCSTIERGGYSKLEFALSDEAIYILENMFAELKIRDRILGRKAK